MATFFGMPDEDCVDLLDRAMRQWHPELVRREVRVQVLMVESDSDSHPVKHAGYAALATIKVVPLKDRLTKRYDVEMLVAHDDWQDLGEARQLALFDHQLSHIAPVPLKAGKIPLDSQGRPKLKMRKGDWNAGPGFASVVARHGDDAIEFENLRRATIMAEAARDAGSAQEGIGVQLEIPFEEVTEKASSAYEVGGPREDVAPIAPPASTLKTDNGPRSVADTGIAIVIRTEGAAKAIKKLVKVGVSTIGELCEWVNRQESGLYAALRSLSLSARDAGLAAEEVSSFLKTHGLDRSAAPANYQPATTESAREQSGTTRFSDIADFPAEAIDQLAAKRISTVEDLDAMVAELRKKPSFAGSTRYTALRELGLDGQLVLAVGDKLVDHFAPKEPPKPVKEKKPAAKKRKGVAK